MHQDVDLSQIERTSAREVELLARGTGLASENPESPDLENPYLKPTQALTGYAIVYVWESRCATCQCCGSCCCSTTKRIGHVSLQLVKSDGARVTDGYISVWPLDETGHKREAKFVPDLAADVRNEENEYPSQKFRIDNVNINGILSKFQSMKSNPQTTWGLWGAGFFKSPMETNCSGSVIELLSEHSELQEKFQKIEAPSRCIGCLETKATDYRKAADILAMANANIQGTHSSRLAALRVTKACCLILFGALGLVTGAAMFGGLTVAVMKWINYNNFSETGKGLFLGGWFGFFSFTAFLAYCCFRNGPHNHLERNKVGMLLVGSIRSCKESWTTISNCGGISPDDLNFLLNYFSSKEIVTTLGPDEIGYSLARDETKINELSDQILPEFSSSVAAPSPV